MEACLHLSSERSPCMIFIQGQRDNHTKKTRETKPLRQLDVGGALGGKTDYSTAVVRE